VARITVPSLAFAIMAIGEYVKVPPCPGE
jgi:hypothetical protein